MRKHYTVSFWLPLLLLACRPSGEKQPAGHEPPPDSAVLTLANQVTETIVADAAVVKPAGGTRIAVHTAPGAVTYDTRRQTQLAARSAGRIERLYVKYNFQRVRKGQLILELYSPELAAAQQELLLAVESGEMLQAARQRLTLLGMTPVQMDDVQRTRRVMYRVPVYSPADGYILEQTAAAMAPQAPQPASNAGAGGGMDGMSGGSAAAAAPMPAQSPVQAPVMLREGQYVTVGQPLFTVYTGETIVALLSFPPSMADRLHAGQKVLLRDMQGRGNVAAEISLVEPVFREGRNFTEARVYLKGEAFRPGAQLTASVAVVYSGGWWVPRKALLATGNGMIVFRRDGGVFRPQAVEVTALADGMAQIGTTMGDWEVAENAAYLIDSESFITPVAAK
ncbi:efflux RND transporter periplasmic adaptor subunit [Chitinophaga lutea]